MWSQETPSQEGTYWFRRNKRQSPEQVTIKDGKVVFLSGNVKALADVSGQWSGPIETKKEPQEGKSESLKRFFNWLLAHPGAVLISVLGTIFTGVLIPFLLGVFSITSSKLVYVGAPPEYPKAPQIVSTKVEDGLFIVHVKHKVPFRNYGVVPDHIERVEIKNDGLNPIPKRIEVLHIEGTELGWLDRKEITIEALIYLDPIHEKADRLPFKTYYYASKGNEVYGGGLVVYREEIIRRK
jgi:hypothetical protein